MGNNKIDLSALSDFANGAKDFFFIYKSFNSENEFYISDSVKQITGYTPDEIKSLPQNIYSIIHEEDKEAVEKTLNEVGNNPSCDSTELVYRIKSKNDELIWLKELLMIEWENGVIKNQKSIVLNINELKKSENDLLKSRDSLKDLNSTKDKFINIISHDLRSPFTTLLGFSEILLNEQDISIEEKNEYLQYIYDSSKSQLNFINCLLDWSRLQTGRIKIEPVRLNVRSVISTAIAPLTGDAVRKNIDVKIEIPSDLFINADERLISQVLINLTSNAIKYTPEGKDIFISSGRFKEGMIEIVVRDEGLGITEENQSKLFRIDQKFSLVGIAGEKGSGLGLTLVKEIIEKHLGQVWFYSQLGTGSEFHFTIPEARNLVLLVEDDQGTRALYKKIIEEALKNFDVKFAENGYEAIGMYKDLHPTLVITDHAMPLMNGIQLVEAIQKKESTRTVPIIVISAKLTDEITRKYLRLGVDKVIAKPVNHSVLVQMIRDCLY